MSGLGGTHADRGAGDSGQGTRTLVLATLQQAGLTLVRFGMPALAPFVRQALSLSLVQVGILLAAIDIGGFPAFIPTGLLADRWGERRVLRAGGIVVGGAAILGALAPSYGLLLLCLAVAGIGFPSGHTAGIKAIVRRFPAHARGFAIGVRQAGLPVGGMAAALLIPALAGLGGWRMALAGAGLLCLLFGLLCGALPSDPPIGERPSVSMGMIPGLLRDRDFRSITLLGASLVVGQFTLAGYLPLYFVDRHGWPLEAAAHLLAWTYLGAIAGRLGWGVVSDRLVGGRRRPVLTWVIVGGAAILLAVSQFPQGGGVVLASALALVGGVCLAGWNGLVVNLFTEWVGIDMAATALGAHLSFMFLGSMVSPPLFGLVVEVTGSYTPAWLMVVLFQGIALLLLGRIREGKRSGDRDARGER
jgi:sugar phosphate permease